MDKNTVKIRVAEMMRLNGWSEAETAERSGTTQSTVHRIITGQIASPRLSTLTRIADAFGVDVSYLTNENKTLPNDDNTYVVREPNAGYSVSPEADTIRLLKTKKLSKSDYQLINSLIKRLDMS